MQRSQGVRTTEFWMFAATGIFLLLNGTSLVTIEQDLVLAWMSMTGLYGGLRTVEKTVAQRAADKHKDRDHDQS